jgi:hypothetical protein
VHSQCRSGSQTEVPFLNCDVRFTPESAHCPRA